ncbi:MAG TPA: glycosyltransferase family 4 protein [Pyrinomonadaceae bacterium]|nr:glycosyltransferase family 4 protein [Pyrinomonadaceae bacterium]
MRILFYNHTGQVGGAERLLLTILGRLDRTNFDPILLCPEHGPLRKMCTSLGVPAESVIVLEARFTWRVDYLLRYLKSFTRVILDLRKKVISADPDLIHANSVRAGLVVTAATVGLNKQIIWHIHDLLPRHPFNSLIRAVGLLSRRTRIIAVAQASADRFIGWFRPLRKRVTVIPNGVDLEKFHPDHITREKIRGELNLADEPVIGIIGRLTPGKGQLELLRAFKRVVTEFPTANLLIAGAPAFNQEYEYAALLKRAASELGISNRVQMLGARDDVAAVMQALDLLVVNSSSEACCLVVLEAMACGVPVLATRTGGTPELIEHGRDGWLVPWRDEDGLATAIMKLIREPDLRSQFGSQAKQRVTARYGIGRYIREIQDFYRESDVVDVYSLARHQPANAVAPPVK